MDSSSSFPLFDFKLCRIGASAVVARGGLLVGFSTKDDNKTEPSLDQLDLS